MSKFAFMFNFSLETTEEEDEQDIQHNMDFFFCVNTDTEEEIERLVALVNDEVDEASFYDFISENEEKYGVHDFSSRPPYFAGYTTYEVEEKDTFACFGAIKDWFEEQGFKTSNGTTMIDFDDYSAEDRYVEQTLYEEDVALAKKYFWSYGEC